MKLHFLIILFLLAAVGNTAWAQAGKNGLVRSDSIIRLTEIKDTTVTKDAKKIKPKHDPRIATRRSLILPGWGQAYNREYWKIPIVYGALAIPTATFIYNNKWYKKTKFAYEAKYTASQPGATHADSAQLDKIDPQLQGLSVGSLQSYRNIFRRDRDYSVLWFLILWGLNVADATVFGHLKDFDVSDNLSMNVQPHINPLNNSRGISLAFSFKKPTQRQLSPP